MRSKVIGFIVCSVVLSAIAELAISHVNAVRNIASAQSGDINHVIKVLVAIGLPIMVTVLVGLAFALIFFRQGEKQTAATYQTKSLPALEAAWTFIPLIIVIGVSVFGSVMLEKMVKPNPDEMQINVVAARYLFSSNIPRRGSNLSSLSFRWDKKYISALPPWMSYMTSGYMNESQRKIVYRV